LRFEKSNFWQREGERRHELLVKAKIELAGKKAALNAMGNRSSCIEEQKEVARAERRVDEARQKLKNVARWTRQLEVESFSYRAAAGGLHEMCTVDIPRALAQLDEMLNALEAYAGRAAPGMAGSAASVARAIDGDVSRIEELRKHTPTGESRAGLTVEKLDPSNARSASDPIWIADLEELIPARMSVAGNDLVLLSPRFHEHHTLSLHH